MTQTVGFKEMFGLSTMERTLSNLSHHEVGISNDLLSIGLPATVFGLVCNGGAVLENRVDDRVVEDVLAIGVVKVFRLREEAGVAFRSMAMASKRLRTDSSTDPGSVFVVEIMDMEQAPGLGRSFEMMDELMWQIVGWSWAQGSLVVVTPQNSEVRARYKVFGFKNVWTDNTWKMVYFGDSLAEQRKCEMVDLSAATELGMRVRRHRDQSGPQLPQ